MSEKEIRLHTTNLEIRSDTERTIDGYAIVFNSLSEDLNGFKELISERALDGVDLSDVFLYSQHKSSDILGNTSAGTLTLTITERGLYFKANLPDTSLGRDTHELIKRGDLKSLSFGFIVQEDTWDTKTQIRTVTKIKKLEEISVVSRPAYSATTVSTRALDMSKRCTDFSGCFNKPNEFQAQAMELILKLKLK